MSLCSPGPLCSWKYRRLKMENKCQLHPRFHKFPTTCSHGSCVHVNKQQTKRSVHPLPLTESGSPPAVICPLSFLAPIRQTEPRRNTQPYPLYYTHTHFLLVALIMGALIILHKTIIICNLCNLMQPTEM